MGTALLVNKFTKGQRILSTILLFLVMFSCIPVGFLFKFIFNDNFGLVNNVLHFKRFENATIPWLVDDKLAMFSIMFGEAWMSTSGFAISE